MLLKLHSMGADIQNEEVQKQLAPESLKTLPEIEAFFSKDYQNILSQI